MTVYHDSDQRLGLNESEIRTDSAGVRRAHRKGTQVNNIRVQQHTPDSKRFSFLYANQLSDICLVQCLKGYPNFRVSVTPVMSFFPILLSYGHKKGQSSLKPCNAVAENGKSGKS